MGVEFTIVKDLASISATISELATVNKVICEEIDSAEFRKEYASLLFDILNTYRVVGDILQPLLEIKNLEYFRENFNDRYQHYTQSYQAALSEPRVNAEFTFEKYLQFRKRKETKTSYPPLKRSFSRLHDFIDKWIDNDIWLAMTIDTLLKMLNRFLGEVSELNSKDPETAFGLYCSTTENLPPYLQIINSRIKTIEANLLHDDVHAVCTVPWHRTLKL